MPTVTREYNAVVSSDPIVPTAPAHDWNLFVSDSLRQQGPFLTFQKLMDARLRFPSDLALRGYTEIVRNSIVRDLLASPKGLQAVPRLSPEFLSAFDRFNLNAQEGYLVSLIDGRLDLQNLLRLSPFDAFTTLFNLARLLQQKAIALNE